MNNIKTILVLSISLFVLSNLGAAEISEFKIAFNEMFEGKCEKVIGLIEEDSTLLYRTFNAWGSESEYGSDLYEWTSESYAMSLSTCRDDIVELMKFEENFESFKASYH